MNSYEKSCQAFNDVVGLYGPLLSNDKEYMEYYYIWLNSIVIKAD